MEKENRDACTLETIVKEETVDEQLSENINQVYYVDVDPACSETTDSQSSQTFEAIAQYVQSTLSGQTGSEEATHVQVTTNDGSIVVVELVTKDGEPIVVSL